MSTEKGQEAAVEKIARAFHGEYEAFAEAHGWETQKDSRVAFDELPVQNRRAMLDTVSALLNRGLISPQQQPSVSRGEAERLGEIATFLEGNCGDTPGVDGFIALLRSLAKGQSSQASNPAEVSDERSKPEDHRHSSPGGHGASAGAGDSEGREVGGGKRPSHFAHCLACGYADDDGVSSCTNCGGQMQRLPAQPPVGREEAPGSEELTMIALALKNHGIEDCTPERGVERLIEESYRRRNSGREEALREALEAEVERQGREIGLLSKAAQRYSVGTKRRAELRAKHEVLGKARNEIQAILDSNPSPASPGLTDFEEAIWGEYSKAYDLALEDSDSYPEWLIGAALACDDLASGTRPADPSPASGEAPKDCERCKGSGVELRQGPGEWISDPCPDCNGTGHAPTSTGVGEEALPGLDWTERGALVVAVHTMIAEEPGAHSPEIHAALLRLAVKLPILNEAALSAATKITRDELVNHGAAKVICQEVSGLSPECPQDVDDVYLALARLFPQPYQGPEDQSGGGRDAD